MKTLLVIFLLVSNAAFADWQNQDVYDYSTGCMKSNHESHPEVSFDYLQKYCGCTLLRLMQHFDTMPATLSADQYAFILSIAEACTEESAQGERL